MSVAAVAVTLPMFAAFEAHIVNVVARIENALEVPVKSIDFGTVFPQEKLDRAFDVRLSGSFRDERNADDVEYMIRQKPKCGLPIPNTNPVEYSVYSIATEDGEGGFVCKKANDGHVVLPLLCPYLSKHEISTDGEGENDSAGINAFHGTIDAWDLQTTLTTQVTGRLAKSDDDLEDRWNVDLKVPCFTEECAQDWPSFVKRINSDVDPEAYIQPKENEHELFGCDLWLEVTGISRIGCEGDVDLMLVLDRSSSIDAGELTALKTAANAFITALAPSTDGTHTGQVTFDATATLNLHLTDNEAAAHAAVNAIVTGFGTNLFDGLDKANAELDDAEVHERPSVPDVIVVITDGRTNTPPDEANAKALAAAEADAARAEGVEIFVVGIGGNVDAEYLRDEIADDASHYFGVASYSDLEDILVDLAGCEGPEVDE